MLNGPYAETREQLAGYYMIDVPDLDAAIAWAARCPGTSGRRDRGAPDLGNVTDEAARAAAEAVARRSYGRLVAHFAARTRDVAAAEDALADAFAAALVDWPRAGVPENPGGLACHRRPPPPDRCGAPARPS